MMWLARFSALKNELEKSLKILLYEPHIRLFSVINRVKPELLRGNIDYKIEQQIAEDIASQHLKSSYEVSVRKNSYDTYENRFVLYAVKTMHQKLDFIISRIKNLKEQNGRSKMFSDAYIDSLNFWVNVFRAFEGSRLAKMLGPYRPKNFASMVLQQKPGYATVYKIWQELKFYLAHFGSDCEISMKSVSELYEIWCFLEIKNILSEKLGFKLRNVSPKSKLKNSNDGLEFSLDDSNAEFYFQTNGIHGEDFSIKLSHEIKIRPDAKASTSNPRKLRTWTVPQKPDILVDCRLKSANYEYRVIWLFDAKYRIALNEELSSGNTNSTDKVPDDAINQMHRYRDSLVEFGLGFSQTSRTVVGAFALYPAMVQGGQVANDETKNPYYDSIRHVNIGAFSLLPIRDGFGNAWLTTFLKNNIGQVTDGRFDASNLLRSIKLNSSEQIGHAAAYSVSYKDLMLVLQGNVTISNGTLKLSVKPNNSTSNEGIESFLKMLQGSLRYIAFTNNVISVEDVSKSNNQSQKITSFKQVKSIVIFKNDNEAFTVDIHTGMSFTVSPEEAQKVSIKNTNSILIELGNSDSQGILNGLYGDYLECFDIF